MKYRSLFTAVLLAALTGLAGCSTELWGNKYQLTHLDPDDPDNTSTTETDEGSEPANLRGWFWTINGAVASNIGHPAWTAFTRNVEVQPLGQASQDITFTFEWTWIGTYKPLVDIWDRAAVLSSKTHACENNSVSIIITGSDGTRVQKQVYSNDESVEGCDVLCDGDIDNCPFDGPAFVPPDNSCLSSMGTVDTPIPRVSDNPCVQRCTDEFFDCWADHDCQIAGNSCLSDFQDVCGPACLN